MKSSKLNLKHLTAAFLSGAVLFSGLTHAASTQTIEVSMDKLTYWVQGKEQPSDGGSYNNGGTNVPESIVYQGTTYVPLRKASELLNTPIYWEDSSRAVFIGTPAVTLYDSKGEPVGTAVLAETEQGLLLQVKVTGLTPGKHGIHIHEKAIAGFDFKTAGGHFNPDGKKHGHDNPEGRHVGDLKNIEAGADGTAEAEILIEEGSLEAGDKYSLLGRSIVIHAKEDDGKTDPAGDSGDRIAGGNIPQ